MPAIRDVVYSSSPDQPVYGVKTIDEVVSESMASRNLPIILLGTFAALALLLASIGIYGVMSYSVLLRTPEIGIRMALGANRGQIFRLIISQAISMAGAGLGIGVLAAIALIRLLPSFSHLLYGVGRKRSTHSVWRLRCIANCSGGRLLYSGASSHAYRPDGLPANRMNA